MNADIGRTTQPFARKDSLAWQDDVLIGLKVAHLYISIIRYPA